MVEIKRVHIKLVPADSVQVLPPLDRSKLPPLEWDDPDAPFMFNGVIYPEKKDENPQ